MLINILYQIFSMLGSVVSTVVIVQFIISLLMAFNVVNYTNKVVYAIWTSLNAILDPILRPIRRHMPDTGAIDFSPLVLLLGINVILIILGNLARGM